MYLLARVIKSMGIKMVLSGEGADEVFGGYLYFHKAPTAQAFHEAVSYTHLQRLTGQCAGIFCNVGTEPAPCHGDAGTRIVQRQKPYQ